MKRRFLDWIDPDPITRNLKIATFNVCVCIVLVIVAIVLAIR